MLDLLNKIFLQPLFRLYSSIFELYAAYFPPGVCLLLFSVTVNLMMMPLYYQMDKHSKGVAAVRDQIAGEVARIKKYFRGRERYFYIRAVHRQYRYHPLSDVFGSADLFVQVVLFITVYHYLSDLQALVGESFYGVSDLSHPDAMLGGVNVLPLLMTVINAMSIFMYMEDPKRRMQALILAGVFLVLLYDSPAGLVLYWTMNNFFSLIRNLVERRFLPGMPHWFARVFSSFADQR